MARRQANPLRFTLLSVSGSRLRSLQQAPRFGPRACSRASPGSGSPVPAFAGGIWVECAIGKQKTLRSAGSGGSV
jgi:hypothetical protein